LRTELSAVTIEAPESHRPIRTEHKVTDETKQQQSEENDTDRMQVNLPFGGGFSVSGPNASKLWGKVGWGLIILATGFVVERVASVFLKLTQ